MSYMDEGATRELTYELVQRAVRGEEDALEEILRIYDPYINSVVTVEKQLPSGEVIEEVDEDMKIQVQMHLVEAIQKKWRELI